MINQRGFLSIATIRPDQPGRTLADLEALLREADAHARDPRAPAIVPFWDCQTIHFCRFVILPAAADAHGQPIPATLAFSTNYDEPLDAHLAEVAEKAQAGLRRIYAFCEGFPDDATPAQIIAYWRQHSTPSAAFYVGTLGRTVAQIRDEERLRAAIGDYLDANKGWAAMPPATIRDCIQKFVGGKPDLAWALTSPPGRDLAWKISYHMPIIIAGVVGLAVLVVALITKLLLPLIVLALVAAGLWWLVLLRNEAYDHEPAHRADYTNDPRDKPKIYALVQAEDRAVQNQFTTINPVKPQPLRLFTLRLVLLVIDLSARYIYNKGNLSNIHSIHFARWVIVDGGRRLAFFSNFDGSWESYLGDFVDRASPGLTAIWGNTSEFPPARHLAGEGSRNEQPFKAIARHYQAHTNVWYSAYPTLTTTNIANNSEIRKGLSGTPTDSEIREWLQRL